MLTGIYYCDVRLRFLCHLARRSHQKHAGDRLICARTIHMRVYDRVGDTRRFAMNVTSETH